MHVSVVLCTYTEDMYPHFSEAAESILSQTYDDVELVVIVDGTQPVYDRVVADYGDRDDVISVTTKTLDCLKAEIGAQRSQPEMLWRLLMTMLWRTKNGLNGWFKPTKKKT